MGGHPFQEIAVGSTLQGFFEVIGVVCRDTIREHPRFGKAAEFLEKATRLTVPIITAAGAVLALHEGDPERALGFATTFGSTLPPFLAAALFRKRHAQLEPQPDAPK